jgi:hypothetical protein
MRSGNKPLALSETKRGSICGDSFIMPGEQMFRCRSA